MPLDLIPDFIPFAGQLDDAIIVALVLRTVLRAAGDDVIREHWPGPERSLGAVLRLAGRTAETAPYARRMDPRRPMSRTPPPDAPP
jgi:uncharacterized membrane protein YkvA (DUF1232 family)